MVGGQIANATSGAGSAKGDGGNVLVVDTNNTVATSGDGAYGIVAQSVGGGGGFAGDPSAPQGYGGATNNAVFANSGNGGTVNVIVANGGKVVTTGRYAPAIFAQSIGGGGGLVVSNFNAINLPNVMGEGSAGGAGGGGPVFVNVRNNDTVMATGVGSAGILAQSDGQTGGRISINLAPGSKVVGGTTDPNFPTGKMVGQDPEYRDAAAIRLLGGNNNVITNQGTIQTLGQYAILAYPTVYGGGPASTTVNNSGTITGDIDIGSGGVVNNLPGGVIDTPTKLNVGGGTMNNAGTLKVGGANSVGKTVLTGNLVQSPSGALNVQIDPANKRSDLLDVTGTAALAGKVQVDPVSYLKSTSTVLTAAGGIQPDATLAGTSTPVYRFTPVMQGNTVAIKTDADFVGASKGTSATQQSVAANLDRLWNSADPAFAPIFGAFGNVGSASGYAQTLTAVSGQELLGIAAARYQASQAFARSVFSCPVFADDDTAVRKQGSCVWFRASGMWENRSADASFPGYGWQGSTMKVGGQVELQPGWFLGGAIGYETDRFTGNDNLTSANGNALLGVVALKHEVGPWTFTGAADASYGWMNSSRVIPGANAVATASPDSYTLGLHLRAAYQIPFDRFYLEPALDADLNDVNLPGYTESGAGALNLKVKSANSVIASGTPNLRIGTRAQIGSATVDAYVGAGVSFIAGNSYTTDASFAAAPGYGNFTNTLTNAHVAGKFSAGVEVYTTKRLDVRLEYDGVVAAHEVENGGQVRLKYRF